ncbi:MAG: helix-turn-helix domain-containing protein [Candidatus Poribacteria bacterium]
MKFMTMNEVEQSLSVNRITVYRLIKSGKLKAIKVNSAVRISEDSFQEFLEENSVDKDNHSTASSILKHVGTWAGPKKEYDKIIKAIKESDTEAEF